MPSRYQLDLRKVVIFETYGGLLLREFIYSFCFILLFFFFTIFVMSTMGIWLLFVISVFLTLKITSHLFRWFKQKIIFDNDAVEITKTAGFYKIIKTVIPLKNILHIKVKRNRLKPATVTFVSKNNVILLIVKMFLSKKNVELLRSGGYTKLR